MRIFPTWALIRDAFVCNVYCLIRKTIFDAISGVETGSEEEMKNPCVELSFSCIGTY